MEVNLKELSNIIKTNIPKNNFILTAEISGLNTRGNHLYFNLKDETMKISSMLWNYERVLKVKLNNGDKVKVEGKINYYENYGNLNFIVRRVIKKEGDGDIYLKYLKEKEEFRRKGYFELERKKRLNGLIKEIVLLTSKDGDALHDFMKNIKREGSRIRVKLVDVSVQGVNCPLEICEYILKVKNKIIVITRGGGNFEDLNGFNKSELVESVYHCRNIIMSAIGHQKDETLLDLVSDVSKPTPSLISQFLVNYNENILNNYLDRIKELKIKLEKNINNELNNLEYKDILLDQENNKIENIIREYVSDLNSRISEENLLLERLENMLINEGNKMYEKISNIEKEIIEEINKEIIILEKEEYKLDDIKRRLIDNEINKRKVLIMDELYKLDMLLERMSNIKEIEIHYNNKLVDSVDDINNLINGNKFIMKIDDNIIEISNYSVNLLSNK